MNTKGYLTICYNSFEYFQVIQKSVLVLWIVDSKSNLEKVLYKRPFIRDFKTFWLKTAISCNLVCFIAVISHSKFLKLIETWIRQQKLFELTNCQVASGVPFLYILFLRMPWWLGCNKFTQNNILCWTLDGNLLQTSSFCQMLQVTQTVFPWFLFSKFLLFSVVKHMGHWQTLSLIFFFSFYCIILLASWYL